jgi:hypothetical protein
MQLHSFYFLTLLLPSIFHGVHIIDILIRLAIFHFIIGINDFRFSNHRRLAVSQRQKKKKGNSCETFRYGRKTCIRTYIAPCPIVTVIICGCHQKHKCIVTQSLSANYHGRGNIVTLFLIDRRASRHHSARTLQVYTYSTYAHTIDGVVR